MRVFDLVFLALFPAAATVVAPDIPPLPIV
jgi:hypothetical protein